MTKIRSYVDSTLGTAWAPWRGSLDKPEVEWWSPGFTSCSSPSLWTDNARALSALSGTSVAALEKLVSCVRLGKLRFLSFFL